MNRFIVIGGLIGISLLGFYVSELVLLIPNNMNIDYQKAFGMIGWLMYALALFSGSLILKDAMNYGLQIVSGTSLIVYGIIGTITQLTLGLIYGFSFIYFITPIALGIITIIIFIVHRCL